MYLISNLELLLWALANLRNFSPFSHKIITKKQQQLYHNISYICIYLVYMFLNFMELQFIITATSMYVNFHFDITSSNSFYRSCVHSYCTFLMYPFLFHICDWASKNGPSWHKIHLITKYWIFLVLYKVDAFYKL